MHWIVKKGFEKDPKYRELCNNLIKMDIKHSFCNVIPFSDDIIDLEIELIKIKEPIFVYGSYTLSKIIKRELPDSYVFISTNLNLDNLLKHYGNEMFNNDMIFGKISEIETNLDTFFMRPLEDSKSFTAKIYNKEEFIQFKNNIKNLSLSNQYSTMDNDTMVCISKPKSIEKEIRFFIINNKISTYSQYKIGDSVLYSNDVEQYVIDYVNKIIKIYEPELSYCLDIAINNGVPKILEINSINSAGLYAIDTQKFIFDIEELIK